LKTWKIGLIGTGWWSEKHLKAWSALPNAQLWALANRSSEKLKAKAQEFGIPASRCFSRIEDLLSSGIDVLDIVTGPDSHREYVEAAAHAGIPILCQKPFAPTLEDAEAMVSSARSAGVRLMVTENWRWLEPYRTLKDLLLEGAVGPIEAVRYVHSDFYTPRMAPGTPLPQPFFRDMPRLLFFEMGPHWFDTWRHLFGDPLRVYAEFQKISPYVQGEDSGMLVLGHEKFTGLMDMSWATRQSVTSPVSEEVGPANVETMVIDGQKGTLRLTASGQILLVSETGSKITIVKDSTVLDHEQSHYRLQSHFLQCLDSGQEFATSGEFVLDTTRLITAAYQSARTHQAVPFFKSHGG